MIEMLKLRLQQIHQRELEQSLTVLAAQIHQAQSSKERIEIANTLEAIAAEMQGNYPRARHLYTLSKHPLAQKFLQMLSLPETPYNPHIIPPVHQTIIHNNVGHISNIQVTQHAPVRPVLVTLPAPTLAAQPKEKRVELKAKNSAISLSSEEQQVLKTLYDVSQQARPVPMTNNRLADFFGKSKEQIDEMLTMFTSEKLVKGVTITEKGVKVAKEIEKLTEIQWLQRPAVLPQKALDAQRSKRPTPLDSTSLKQEPPMKISAILK
jgi:hypothetical protein